MSCGTCTASVDQSAKSRAAESSAERVRLTAEVALSRPTNGGAKRTVSNCEVVRPAARPTGSC